MAESTAPSSSFDPGSFRDPMSRVLVRGDDILRVLGTEAVADWEALAGSSFFPKAVAEGRIVRTERLPADEVAALGPGAEWEAVLRHDRVPMLSYPYEWSFEMLKDAAKLQLELTAAAIDDGMITKDASSYNIQFVGAQPTFIDIGSFERIRKGEPWYGYRQFCQLFLYPLMLQAYRDVPFQPWLRGSIDGITPEECHNALSVRDRFRRGAFSTVLMHARADAKHADSDRDVKGEMSRAGMGPALIAAMVSKLHKTVDRLTWSKSSTTWSDYSDRAHYSDADLQLKSEFVGKVAAASPRQLVWDVGANDAHFSRIAADHADHVVAFDVDPLVVDRTYKTLRDEGEKRIQPMLMNLADPSPGLGWRGLERPTLLQRGRPDLVLCLAVIHHLAITNTVPLAEFVRWLAEVGSETVVEFPTREDPMVKILLRNKRSGLFDGYNLAAFEALLAEEFGVVAREELPSGTRVLFHARPRG